MGWQQGWRDSELQLRPAWPGIWLLLPLAVILEIFGEDSLQVLPLTSAGAIKNSSTGVERTWDQNPHL